MYRIYLDSAFKNQDINKPWKKEDDTFLKSELIRTKKLALETVYPSLQWANGNMLPISFELPEGTEWYKYKIYNALGLAKYISNGADDLPRVGLDVAEIIAKILNSANEFAWTFKDLRSAKLAGRKLNTRLMSASKRAHMSLFNDTIQFGNAVRNVLGFYNNSNITEYAVSTVGSGTPNTAWLVGGIAKKTPAQIVADICGILNSIENTSKETQLANRLYLPTTHYQHIACTSLSTTDNTKILASVQGIFPNVRFIQVRQLAQAILTANGILGPAGGALTGSMMIAANVNKETVEVQQPMPYKVQPSYQQGLEIRNPSEMETGGCDIFQPLAFAYGKNI